MSLEDFHSQGGTFPVKVIIISEPVTVCVEADQEHFR
jgi:hypothetical protein